MKPLRELAHNADEIASQEIRDRADPMTKRMMELVDIKSLDQTR